MFNTKTKMEIWMSRRYVGEVSRIEEPVVIVGLLKELEYKAGAVLPHERRVIEMPRAVNGGFQPAAPPPKPAPVVGIRLETKTESRIGRLMLAMIALGIVGCVLVVSFFHGGLIGTRVNYAPVLQDDLQFSANDDYFSIVRHWGPPAEERWRAEQGELHYRLLSYPSRTVSLILMGTDRKNVRYLGAFDKDWRVVHSVPWPGNRDSATILKSLKRF